VAAIKVLISDPLSPAGIDLLKEAGIEVIEKTEGGRESYQSVLPEIDGWIVRSGTRVSAEDIAAATRLKAIGRAGVGVDNIDQKAATHKGVVVMNTPGGNTVSAAEHTIALLMSLARNVHLGHGSMAAGRWDRKKLVGTELMGKTMGVIGLGRIGQEVAKRAQGLQMNVLGFDPYLDADHVRIQDLEFTTFEELLEQADVVTLHLPKSAETIDLIDRAQFESMKESAFLINCARGGIVNETALAQALENNAIAGAAVDVYSSEPPEDNPLLKAPNIVLTPHLGASTREAGENVATQVARQVRDYLLEETLANAVNLPISDLKKLQVIQAELALAERLGWLQHYLHQGVIEEFRFLFTGDAEFVQPLEFSAIKGLVEARHGDNINFINASAVAEARGVHVTSVHDTDFSRIPNVISLRVTSKPDEAWEITGYVDKRGGHRLIRINQYHLDVLMDGPLLLLLNKDVPGVVGEVGTVLGAAGINIAEYALSRDTKSGLALSVIKSDAPMPAEILSEIDRIPAVSKTYIMD